MAAMTLVKTQWRQFKHDQPGQRFQNQRRRMRSGPRWLMVTQVTAGIVLVAAGVVFLFIPGPGLPLIVFGLALIAGLSRKLAGVLDRGEPPVRRGAIAARDRWRALPVIAKVGLGAIAALIVAAFAYGMYQLWFA